MERSSRWPTYREVDVQVDEPNPYEAPRATKGMPVALSSAEELYRDTPLVRRETFCSWIITVHCVSLFLSFNSLLLIPVAVISCFGVLFVCGVAVTGPVYRKVIDPSTGQLKRWGIANKIAAVLVACILTALMTVMGVVWMSA